MAAETCLTGVVVVERDDRLAVSVCGTLLAELGATVVRVETGAIYPGLTEPALRRAAVLARSGKTSLALDLAAQGDLTIWHGLVERADILLLSPAGAGDDELVERESRNRVVVAVTTLGRDALADDCGEIALQAMGGIMACTGKAAGAPEQVQVPIVEMMTGINAATAALSALRQHERHGVQQTADVAAFDSEVALFTAFVSNVADGKKEGYRLGCGHHLCAPWNAYPTADGWVQICLAADAQWHSLLGLIGRPDKGSEERFADNAGRVRNSSEVDALIVEWTGRRSSAEIVASLLQVGLPVGLIRTIPDVLDSPDFIARGMVGGTDAIDDPGSAQPGSFLRMGRTPGLVSRGRSAAEGHAVLAELGPTPRREVASGPAEAKPLSGIRVLEIGPYTAGPLAGRYLADLGAEVIKIEPPGGEVSRSWTPQFEGHSGYFANCNVGKSSLVLDLRSAVDRESFLELVQSSDVLLENLRPGALEKLGFGPQALTRLAPRLIYCSVSGFGHTGALRPALDSVVQAEAGMMWLVGGADEPQRVGVSIADQAIAHAAPLAILAALRFRDSHGRGQHVDLAMCDVLAWLTQLAWPDGRPALVPWTQTAMRDGWIVAACSAETLDSLLGEAGLTGTRQEAVDCLRRAGVAAAPVLEMGEVFQHEAIARRGLVQFPDADGARIPVLSAPFRLGGRALVIGKLVGDPDCDRHRLIRPKPAA